VKELRFRISISDSPYFHGLKKRRMPLIIVQQAPPLYAVARYAFRSFETLEVGWQKHTERVVTNIKAGVLKVV
jgi:hypothetical protein